MSSTEICVTGAIRSLDADDESINVQDYVVVVEVCLIVRVLQRDGQLLIISWMW